MIRSVQKCLSRSVKFVPWPILVVGVSKPVIVRLARLEKKLTMLYERTYHSIHDVWGRQIRHVANRRIKFLIRLTLSVDTPITAHSCHRPRKRPQRLAPTAEKKKQRKYKDQGKEEVKGKEGKGIQGGYELFLTAQRAWPNLCWFWIWCGRTITLIDPSNGTATRPSHREQQIMWALTRGFGQFFNLSFAK